MDFIRVLNKDASGPDVQLLSEYLAGLGYDTGPVHEQTFGNHLEKAVKEFQADFGVKSDGVVGPNTMKALTEALDLVRPGSLRLSDDTRTKIAALHDEIYSRVEKLSKLVGRSLELDSDLPVRQFTLTQTRQGRRVNLKLDPGRISVGNVTQPAMRPIAGAGAVCYWDPPGICEPCSAIIIITAAT
ncbi:MAG: peptidoglycan-binding domain-containing protein [Pyrinomonadaceae bacterium]